MAEEYVEVEARKMPPKSMPQDAVKNLIEEMLESTLEELKKTKGKDKKDGSDIDEEGNKEDGEAPKRVEEIHVDQTEFVDALNSVNRDTIDGLPIYSGSMEAKEVIDWIEALTNHFEYKEIPQDNRVKLAKARLKGFALTWWNYVQGERVKEGKSMITSWERMKAEVKAQFMPIDYEVQIYKKLQNLRQRDLDVNAYIEEFHKLGLRSKRQEQEPKSGQVLEWPKHEHPR